MAIQLPGTPQQQKAPFSAFDTSSNFRSGLVDVGQAIRDVGAGQQRLQEKAERDLEKREKLGQTMLGQESALVFNEKLGELQVRGEEANSVGNITEILAVTKELNALNPKNSNWNINDHLPQNRRSDLTDEMTVRKTTLEAQAAWNKLDILLRTKRATSETLSRTLQYIDKATESTVNFLDKHRKSGASNEELTSSIYEIVNDPMHPIRREATTLGTPRNSFDSNIKQLLLDRIMNQFENSGVLSEDEVNSRMETISSIITDPKLAEAGIVFDGGDEKSITEAFEKKLIEIQNPDFQKEQVVTIIPDVSSQLSAVMNADIIRPENLRGIKEGLTALSEIDPRAFSPTQRKKFESMAQLASMFLSDPNRTATARAGLASAVDARERDYWQSELETANEDPLAYQVLQYMARVPKARDTTVSTALKDLFGADFASLAPASTEQSMLSDWISKNLKALRNIGDNPRALGRLSPYHADLVQKAAQGDKSARYNVEKEYSDFVENHPDLASVAPPDFYVTQQETATTTLGNEKTFKTAVQSNAILNGPKSTLSHAAFKLNQGDLSKLEILRYRSEQLFAETLFSSGGNVKMAESAISTLVTNYKAGLDADSVTDNLHMAIVTQNNKFDVDEEGDRLSLIALTEVYKDSSEPSKKDYHTTILKGFIELHKEHLVELDSPKKQHAFIRDKLFENKDMFPHVAALGNGGVVELPIELNKYIDPAKDRAGFIARSLDGVVRALGDGKESIENVGTVFTTAALLYISDQNPSLNINQILQDIGESVSPSVIEGVANIRTTYSGLSGSEATALPLDSKDERAKLKRRDALRTRRALITGLTQNTLDGKPLLKFSVIVQQNEIGTLEKVVVMNVINSDGIYEPLARSAEDRRPITAPLSQIMPIVGNTIPRITSFMQGVGDDTGNVDAELRGNYPLQLLNIERPNIARLTHRVHEQTYNKELMSEDRVVPIWQY